MSPPISLPAAFEIDPASWSTDAEPMTAAQAQRLEALCRRHGRPVERRLTRAEARRLIAALETGAGARP